MPPNACERVDDRLRLSVSRTSVKSVEVLAFAYIRTGTTADRRTDQNGFEVKTSASAAIA
jgi:hypothetical protein